MISVEILPTLSNLRCHTFCSWNEFSGLWRACMTKVSAFKVNQFNVINFIELPLIIYIYEIKGNSIKMSDMCTFLLQNDALWDIHLMHHGICDMKLGALITARGKNSIYFYFQMSFSQMRFRTIALFTRLANLYQRRGGWGFIPWGLFTGKSR